jgi:hypothetical protein
MDFCRSVTGDIRKMPGHGKTGKDVEQWQRWDEELVEEFGRWISRLAKACAILLIAIVTAALLQLIL